MSDSPSKLQGMRMVASVICVLLALEFLLGFYVNLYVSIPQGSYGHHGGNGSMMSNFGTMISPGQPALMIHLMLGVLVVVAGVVGVVLAASSGDRFALGWSTVGLLALFLAGYGGLAFLMYGQGEMNSYIMAVGFLISFTAYLTGTLRDSSR